MSTQNDDEEFEFLLNLLASDGVDPSPPGAGGSRKGHEDDRGFGIKRGADGKLDLGQVKAFYEKKNLGVGKGMGKGPGVGTATDDPGSTDHFRNHSGSSVFFSVSPPNARTRVHHARLHPMSCGVQGFWAETLTHTDCRKNWRQCRAGKEGLRAFRTPLRLHGHRGKTNTDNRGLCMQVLETEISVSRSVSEHEDQSVSPLSLTPAPPDAARLSSVRSAAPSFGKPSQDLVDDFQVWDGWGASLGAKIRAAAGLAHRSFLFIAPD